jgi:NAD(P)H-hydrate epimerase
MKAVTTAQMRALDERTIAAGTPASELMERAGATVACRALKMLRQAGSQSALLLAGKGNNGGDAVVAARHLEAAGCRATVVSPVELNAALLKETKPGLIVDGLLGTGLAGDVREPFVSAIRFINESRLPVLAIDIPSGLDGDTGEPHGVAVRADVTLTIGLPKIGLLRAPDYVGTVEVADIGFPSEFVAEISSDVELLTPGDVAGLLPARRRDSHKGDFGHLLIIAGSEGYTGAPVLCAHAAARSGAGLVTLAVPREVYPIVAAQCPPEVMPRPLDRLGSWESFTAVALGPGLGLAEGTQRQVWHWLDSCRQPLVVDADGLNALARNVAILNHVNVPVVLTPHPGEMGRLISQTAAAVQARRWDVAREFAKNNRLTLVLKGAGTVVAANSGPLWINPTGNPGMAKGGMGDALTGIIGALLAQGLKPFDAARVAVYVHGFAGDLAAARVGERGLLASDLIAELGTAFAGLD